MITVEQLIKQLEKFPPDMEVRTCLYGHADVFHEIAHLGDIKPELSRYSDRNVICVIHPKFER
jgi:hypothetical protein